MQIHRAFLFGLHIKKQGKNNTMEQQPSPVSAADLAKNAYRQQWGVILICRDEQEQIKVFNALSKKYPNNKIKVVTT